MLCGMLTLSSTVLADGNKTLTGTIEPLGGTTITETETNLSGQFTSSGCGLGGTILVNVPSGSVSSFNQWCEDGGIWNWSAVWSGYSAGDQTVMVTFETRYGGRDGLKWLHYGAILATYHVVTVCELPAAPAIANHYMHDVLNIRSRDIYNTIIPQVAHAMNAGYFGSPCDPGYAEEVEAFVLELYNSL
jgi:hypothetical protein